MHKSILVLLILVLVGATVGMFLPVNANPNLIFHPIPSAPAPAGVQIIFDIESPKENTTYNNGTVNVVFNVTVDGPSQINGQALNKHIMLTTYQGDWMQKSEWAPSRIFQTLQFYPYNFNIFGIPFGEHTLNFTTHAQGNFVLANYSGRVYSLEKTISFKFFVLANPLIEFLSPQSSNSTTSSFPLNFTVDHPVTEIAYRLDGQESVPINGNTTLTDLHNGQHNVTVYATDEFGYTGKSDTLYFNVDAAESIEFPVAPLFVASVVVAVSVVACIGALVFRRKQKQSKTESSFNSSWLI
jgi:hypothetical protein